MASDQKILDCRDLIFDPDLARQRQQKAVETFGQATLNRIVGFSLYILGGERSRVAQTIGAPAESLKTTLRVLQRDGVPAFEDRRRRDATPAVTVRVEPPRIVVRSDSECVYLDLGVPDKPLSIPRGHPVQLRTVLLTLFNAGLLDVGAAAEALDLTTVRVRQLAVRLETHDASDLADQRRGQLEDYRITPDVKGELVQQAAAHALTGRPTSSAALAEALMERLGRELSERSIRRHLAKLGLDAVAETFPALVESLKKNSRR